MKGADAVICAIGSSGFNPKGPKTVDYEVTKHPFVAAVILCLLCLLMHWPLDPDQPPTRFCLVTVSSLRLACTCNLSMLTWMPSVSHPPAFLYLILQGVVCFLWFLSTL